MYTDREIRAVLIIQRNWRMVRNNHCWPPMDRKKWEDLERIMKTTYNTYY